MSSSQDDFDQLKTLLVCKRYEQPPPGYFVHFSDRVIARIEVEELGGTFSWWDWLVEKLTARPILACAYGTAVSAMLIVGFRFSEIFDTETAETTLSTGLNLVSTQNQAAFPGAFGSVTLFDRSAVVSTTSLSPAFRQQEPLSDLYRGHSWRAQTVGFSRTY